MNRRLMKRDADGEKEIQAEFVGLRKAVTIATVAAAQLTG
jgi:hypothetical protein